MKYVFGPVPSRRLGRSLGIDPVPLKTCNWNCVYCQLGRSCSLTNDRRDLFPPDEIVAEVAAALAGHRPGAIDWVTFVASGETLLHAHLGLMLREVRALTDLPVAVITNGSLLYLQQVRRDLVAADAVLPSFDAGNPDLYRRVNRPHPQITFERHRTGLFAFREEYEGKLWLETMLVRGLNDTEAAIRELSACIAQIQPDEVHINIPTRPPAETWVQPPDDEGLMRAISIIQDVVPVRLIYPVEGTVDLEGCDNILDGVIGIITRHPLRDEELSEALGRWSVDEVEWALAQLEASRRARVITRHGQRFWVAASTHFPYTGEGSR